MDDFVLDPTKNFTPRSNPKPEGMVATAPTAKRLKTPLQARTAAELAEAASQRLDLAIEAVEAILRDPVAKNSDKLAAAAFIRDTAHGKPGQSVEVTGKIGIIEVVMEAVKLRKPQDIVIDNITTNRID